MAREFHFPLKQHVGAESIPVVVPGERVKRGQMIAGKEKEQLGANLHSSVSGVVSKVEAGEIVILADEIQTKEYVKLKAEEPLALIEEAGIVGLGGAGFPTVGKLKNPFKHGGLVIVNGAECEPILGHNVSAAEKHPKRLLRGLEIVMEIVHAERGVVAVKGIHKEAVEKLCHANWNSAVEIRVLPDLYPMGEERALIREVAGRLLPVDSLPSEAGAVVLNAETVLRIQEAVDLKKPLIDKDMTVAGKMKGNENLIQILEDVPIGTSVEEVFGMAGGLGPEYGELIMGGPFTGKRTCLRAPVVKTTGGLIAAECFMKGPEKIGLLVCACGADKERMEEMAASMGSQVAGIEYCKQAKPVKHGLKCENPGKCPGQVQKVMALKKAGAQALLISNCTDCTNTVMSCGPKLGLPVYHCTDGSLRAVNHRLIRRMKKE